MMESLIRLITVLLYTTLTRKIGIAMELVMPVTKHRRSSISLPLLPSPKAGKIILAWTTESEISNAGFNLYRSHTRDGGYIKINDTLIPAAGSPLQGAAYEFVDNSITAWKPYFYKLEDIDMNGTATVHGPVFVWPRMMLGFR